MSEMTNTANILICGGDGGTVHIREVMAEFQCHKVVMAAVIKSVAVLEEQDDLSLIIGLPGTDIELPYLAAVEMIQRYTPVVGDYLVLYENDYVAISPKDVFEDGYREIEFTAVSQGEGNDDIQVPTENMDLVTSIAKMCHEVTRSYCQVLREPMPAWSEAEQHHRDKAIAGVALYIMYPTLGPSARHDNWMSQKLSQGWTYGKAMNLKAKKHHSLKPFHHLPVEQQAKGHIFHSIVHQAVHQG